MELRVAWYSSNDPSGSPTPAVMLLLRGVPRLDQSGSLAAAVFVMNSCLQGGLAGSRQADP